MKSLLFAVATLLGANALFATAPDTVIVAPGIGTLETAINNDVDGTGARNSHNRVYLLQKDQVYTQQSPILFSDSLGTLQIVGEKGGSLPVWIKVQYNSVKIDQSNIYGSFTLKNVQYENAENTGYLPLSTFNVTGSNHHLLVDNVMAENCFMQLFGMDGVPVGADIRITNSYFRDFHDFSQWWAARVVEMKVPVDTFIVENCSFSGCGLTFLAQKDLIEYAFINHNTFVNNTKYPFLSQFWKECYFTNNLFVNTNWVGEDSINVATGGQDPDGIIGHAMYEGIFGVDTILGAEVKTKQLHVNAKWILDGDSTKLKDGLGLDQIKIYAADNITISSTTLSEYYNGDLDAALAPGTPIVGQPQSYLNWNGAPAYPAPFPVMNLPGGMWQNWRADHLMRDHKNIAQENNSIYKLSVSGIGMVTDPLPQAAADVYMVWNEVQWVVPGAVLPTDFSKVIFGDNDPTTFPGPAKNENADKGITKISDLKESFAYTSDQTSKSDGLRIGTLLWNDEAYNSARSTAAVKAAYVKLTAISTPTTNVSEIGVYPNPTTGILNLKAIANVSVTNVAGQTVLMKNNASTIDLSNLANGLYFVKVGNKTTKVEKR